jgi:hypothetical protein
MNSAVESIESLNVSLAAIQDEVAKELPGTGTPRTPTRPGRPVDERALLH